MEFCELAHNKLRIKRVSKPYSAVLLNNQKNFTTSNYYDEIQCDAVLEFSTLNSRNSQKMLRMLVNGRKLNGLSPLKLLLPK